MHISSPGRSLFALCMAALLLSKAMVDLTSVKLSVCSLLCVLLFNACSIAQSSPNTTSINGASFPSLIEVTAEDLNVGLEAGLFTSVDLVNVRFLFIIKVCC